MNRQLFYQILQSNGQSDYELYLNTHDLFACQIDYAKLCNRDELQFQLVHQIEELLMKLVVYTILDIDECIQKRQTHQVVSLFKRVSMSQSVILHMLDFLGTMSPKEYQEIRKKLGQGSGRNSPGFKAMMQLFSPLWQSYKKYYLEQDHLTLEDVYDYKFDHSEAYVVAECLVDFDVSFQQFLAKHMQVIARSIGEESKSLRGREVKKLNKRVATKFFPALWKLRSEMTERWSEEHGVVRDNIKHE